MATISLEARPVSISSFGHINLIFTDDTGTEFVIRGGPQRSNPFSFGDIVTEAGVTMAQSLENRPVSEREQNGSMDLDLGGRDATDVWATMVRSASLINTNDVSYILLGGNAQNSNSTIAAVLQDVGFDLSAMRPDADGVSSYPGYANKLLDEYARVFTAEHTSDLTDILRGGVLNDTFEAGGGDDDIDGRGGVDVAVYSGGVFGYVFAELPDGAVSISDIDGLDGTDTLRNVEFARFSDGTQVDLNNLDEYLEPPIGTGTVQGVVYFDADNTDGLSDADSRLTGETVRLLDADGALVATTKTVNDGFYRFSDVAEGDYIVEVAASDGLEFITANQGREDRDSDITDASTGQSDLFTVDAESVARLQAGLTLAQEPAGFGTVQGFVFKDQDDSDTLTEGDTRLMAETINLLDADGALVSTLTTGALGFFRFDDVAAGTYVLDVVTPDGTAFVNADIGKDSLDSDIDPNTGRSAEFTVFDGGIVRIQAGVEDVDFIV